MQEPDEVFVVFLKDQSLWVEECRRADLFARARQHQAGICAVFSEDSHAQEMVARLQAEQQRLWRP